MIYLGNVMAGQETRGGDSMRLRIAVWASVGFLVAAFWAIYFAMLSKDLPVNPIVNALATFSCPLALVGNHFHFGVKLYSVLVTNTAFYGLFGLIVEALRRQLNPAK
jgi:hypothetical protein